MMVFLYKELVVLDNLELKKVLELQGKSKETFDK